MAAAVCLLGCQRQTPEQELIQKAAPVGSWCAALQMAGEKWAANSVPGAFLRTSADTAEDTFRKTAEEVESSDARADVRGEMAQIIAGGEGEADRLRRAVAAEDRRAAAPSVQRLAALHARFEALRKSIEGPQT